MINNKKVKVQVWDTGGQQRYRPILASCYRGALGVIIVFDVTNKMSFNNIKQWIDEVDEFATESNLPRILVCKVKRFLWRCSDFYTDTLKT